MGQNIIGNGLINNDTWDFYWDVLDVNEKTRDFFGDDAAPFQVHVKELDDGTWLWEIDDPKTDAEVAAVAKALQDGLTIGQTAEALEITKSQVETRKKKAKEQGLI